MKTFTYYLTSEQLPALLPKVLDGWFYTDPVYGLNFTYPATADGGHFLTTTFELTADDGLFFPWGYQVQNQVENISLTFKGDTSLTIVASGIDISQHDALKLVFNSGLDQSLITFNRPLVATSIYNIITDLVANTEVDSPTFETATFAYLASSQPVTYFPSVTAYFGDTTTIFFNFTVTVYPNSIYDLGNVHLLDVAPALLLSASYVKVYEIGNRQITLGLDEVL